MKIDINASEHARSAIITIFAMRYSVILAGIAGFLWVLDRALQAWLT